MGCEKQGIALYCELWSLYLHPQMRTSVLDTHHQDMADLKTLLVMQRGSWNSVSCGPFFELEQCENEKDGCTSSHVLLTCKDHGDRR